MAIIQLRLQCSDKFIEALPDEIGNAELMVESLVSQALLEIFNTVMVDNVTFKQAPSLEVTLQGESDNDQVKQRDVETTAQVIESIVSQVLQEMFGTVIVDEVTIKQASTQRNESSV